MKRTVMLSVTLLVLSLMAGNARADDWPGWRGPDANGISRETGWNPTALRGSPQIAWRSQVGEGHSNVSVIGKRLFTMGSRTLGSDYHEVVYCLDAGSGREIWSYSYPSEKKRFPGPGSTPASDGILVYSLSWKGELYCFDTTSGKVLWRRHLVRDGLAEEPGWGFNGSPVIEGEALLLNAGSAGLALDRRTGKVLWSSQPEGSGMATPVLCSHDGKRLALISAARTLNAVDVATGEVQWSHPWDSYADPVLAGDGRIFLSGNRDRNNLGWALLGLRSAAPEVIWHRQKTNFAFQSWVVLGEYAYGIQNDRSPALLCVELSTGDVVWEQDIGEWGGVTATTGHKLIILTGTGDLIVAEVGPDAFREISKAAVLRVPSERQTGEDPNTCWTSPVLANGKVYARTTRGELVCVDLT